MARLLEVGGGYSNHHQVKTYTQGAHVATSTNKCAGLTSGARPQRTNVRPHLGGEVLGRAAERVGLAPRGLEGLGQPKVDELGVPVPVDHHVLGLEVAERHLAAVKVERVGARG